MRTLALLARAGAVVVVVALGVGLLVDADPRPPTSSGAESSDALSTTVTVDTTEDGEETVPAREGPTELVTFALVGDIAFDGAVGPAARRGTLFADVQTDLAGDVVVGTLVGGVSTRQAEGLGSAGFTVMTLAEPTGNEAQTSTASLVAAGLQSAGRPGRVTVQQVTGTRVAVLGVEPGADPRRAVRQASALADLVVVSIPVRLQGGRIPSDVRRTARASVDAGADVVVGHGAGGVRAMEWYRRRVVAYGLGAFAGSAQPSDAPAAILRLTLRGDGAFETGLLVSTVRGVGGRARLDDADTAVGLVDERSSAAFGARAVEVGADGVIAR